MIAAILAGLAGLLSVSFRMSASIAFREIYQWVASIRVSDVDRLAIAWSHNTPSVSFCGLQGLQGSAMERIPRRTLPDGGNANAAGILQRDNGAGTHLGSVEILRLGALVITAVVLRSRGANFAG